MKKLVLLLAILALAVLVACGSKPVAKPVAPIAQPQPVETAPPAEEPAPVAPVEEPAPAEPVKPEPVVVTSDQLGTAGESCGEKETQKDKDACCTTALKIPALLQGGKCLPIG